MGRRVARLLSLFVLRTTSMTPALKLLFRIWDRSSGTEFEPRKRIRKITSFPNRESHYALLLRRQRLPSCPWNEIGLATMIRDGRRLQGTGYRGQEKSKTFRVPRARATRWAECRAFCGTIESSPG